MIVVLLDCIETQGSPSDFPNPKDLGDLFGCVDQSALWSEATHPY
jgi:hypothetical protein